jgi:hypothetical protein
MSEAALTLAALRTAGPQARPVNPATAAAVRAAAERAGRTLVTLPGDRWALGWSADSEPIAGGSTGVERVTPPLWVTLTFAAALRACWIDLEAHPFPGQEVPEEQVLAAVAALGALDGSITDGTAIERHQKGALVKLRAAGLLDPEPYVVRLGWRVALWSDREVRVLRHVHEKMPVAPEPKAAS